MSTRLMNRRGTILGAGSLALLASRPARAAR